MVVAAYPVDVGELLTNPRAGVVLGSVFEDAELREKAVEVGWGMGFSGFEEGLGEGVGAGIDDEPKRAEVIFFEGLENEI